MNTARYIARRWAFSTPLRHTRNILRMGMGSMGLCVAVMVISLCVLVGFKTEISRKVFGFGSHVVVQPYWSENESEGLSIRWDSALQAEVLRHEGIVSAQAYTLKGALIKGREESFGVFFKGLPPNFDTSFFADKLVRGHLPALRQEGVSPQVLVSELLARKLRVDTGQRLRAFFVHQGELRPRALSVCGIYATGLETFDASYVIGDISLIQQINAWDSTQADGVDITLLNPDDRFRIAQILNQDLPYEYSSFPCDRLFPAIFDWLALVDTNVFVLIVIMLIVCMICLVSLLFILLIERRPHVGVLKTLGADNRLVRNIFIIQTLTILGRSLLIGNAVALLLCLLQKVSGVLRLDESVYFLDRVPIAFPWLSIVGINLLVMGLAALLLYALSFLINKTSPASLNRA